VALSRGVDPIEVAGTLLFVPVFAGFLFLGVPGGLALGVAAGVAYLVLRWPAIQLVGWKLLIGQIAARVVGYILFGIGGGWAMGQIRATLEKLELQDDIDDETGLGNARSMLKTVDLERARADRYQKLFSVVAADFTAPGWDEFSPRRQRTMLRELGIKVAAAVRATDNVAHARRGNHHIIGVVLPETAAGGARIFADNLHRQLTGLTPTGEVRVATATYPAEPEPLGLILDLFKELDRAQRPTGD
jgi:GGDEF domain-containing protein